MLSTDAKRHPKFWRSHIGVSQGGELERERDDVGRVSAFSSAALWLRWVRGG